MSFWEELPRSTSSPAKDSPPPTRKQIRDMPPIDVAVAVRHICFDSDMRQHYPNETLFCWGCARPILDQDNNWAIPVRSTRGTLHHMHRHCMRLLP